MFDQVITQVVNVLVPIILTLIVVGLKYVVNFLSAKASGVKNEVARESLVAALMEAQRVAIDAINYVKQTLTDELKKKSADGKLTKEEAEQALEAAKEYFLTHLSANALSILTAGLDPIEDWVTQFIESKLSATKQAANPS
jgi:hypothetical protein